MPRNISKTVLTSKTDFDSSICEAIREAVNKFKNMTGLIPSTIKFEMKYD